MASSDLRHQNLARIAYEAHRGASPAFPPPWEDATEQEQRAWMAAVAAVTNQGDPTLTEAPPVHALVVQADGQAHVFHKDFTAGRQGTLAVDDEHASNHHVLFQFAHGLWYVQDLDSTNGTWLNGRRVFQSQRLRKGDKIRLGHTVMTVISA